MKKIIAVLSVAALLFSLAACGSKETSEPVTEISTTTAVTTEAPTEAITESLEETTPEEATEAVPEETEKTKWSTEEIVELYNTAANKIKPAAKSVTRNYSKVSCPDHLIELPKAIEGIGKTAMKTFVKGSDKVETWTSKEDIKNILPVGGEQYTSKLTADMVKSATIEETDTTYKIELKLYDDKITSPKKGQGFAGVFNTVSAQTFEDISIPTVTFNEVKINGINGSISVTIDKQSGHVTKITFRNTDIMKINVKVALSTLDCSIGLQNENDFTIQY